MKFQQPDRVDVLVGTLVSRYLTEGTRANLTDSALAELLGVSKMTLYKYRKTTPDRRLAVVNFLNLIAALEALETGFKEAALPVKSRGQGRQFVRRARQSMGVAGQES